MNEENPTVYITHALVEVHLPRLSVRRNNFEKEFSSDSEEVDGQLQELNAQLRFYDEMLGNSPYRVYMSDHGLNHLNNMHVLFQVYHAAWKKREVNKLFCYLDFFKIMHQLLIGETIDDNIWDRHQVRFRTWQVWPGDQCHKPYLHRWRVLYESRLTHRG